VLLSLSACAAAAPDPGSAFRVRLRPLETPPEVAAAHGRIGSLCLIAAYQLLSDHPGFGGLSAVQAVGPDLLLLSDRSHLFRARRVEAPDGHLTGLRDWAELPLPRELRGADTEALALTPDGRLVVGSEDRESLFRLEPDGRATAIPLPPFLRETPRNKGIEALAALPDGRLLAITEGLYVGPDLTAAGLIDGDRAVPLAARAPDGFEPSDANLAGGTLLLLERRLSLLGGLEARLLAIPLADALAHPAQPLDGPELARLGIGSFGENFEGVAVRPAADGGYLLDLVSDDNFNPLLRSLLLELAWQPPGS
jgi:hypothetical protein